MSDAEIEKSLKYTSRSTVRGRDCLIFEANSRQTQPRSCNCAFLTSTRDRNLSTRFIARQKTDSSHCSSSVTCKIRRVVDANGIDHGSSVEIILIRYTVLTIGFPVSYSAEGFRCQDQRPDRGGPSEPASGSGAELARLIIGYSLYSDRHLSSIDLLQPPVLSRVGQPLP